MEINLIRCDTRNELQKLRVQIYFDTKLSLIAVYKPINQD